MSFPPWQELSVFNSSTNSFLATIKHDSPPPAAGPGGPSVQGQGAQERPGEAQNQMVPYWNLKNTFCIISNSLRLSSCRTTPASTSSSSSTHTTSRSSARPNYWWEIGIHGQGSGGLGGPKIFLGGGRFFREQVRSEFLIFFCLYRTNRLLYQLVLSNFPSLTFSPSISLVYTHKQGFTSIFFAFRRSAIARTSSARLSARCWPSPPTRTSHTSPGPQRRRTREGWGRWTCPWWPTRAW